MNGFQTGDGKATVYWNGPPLDKDMRLACEDDDGKEVKPYKVSCKK